jgi:hypothetical protein
MGTGLQHLESYMLRLKKGDLRDINYCVLFCAMANDERCLSPAWRPKKDRYGYRFYSAIAA